jgi:outer membrane protein OmpA-like peptidoglycan-associated protein/tetratricopeptide (TPR) repeat protein
MRSWLFILSFAGASLNLFAQSTNITTLFVNDFKKAEEFYKILAYRNALELYLHYEERHTNDRLVKERIADCYVKLGNYSEASSWYEKLVVDPKVKPIELYRYAEVLSMTHQYTKALAVYRQYQKAEQGDSRTKLKIAFLDLLEFHRRDSNLYSITHEWFNSDQSDFGAHYFRDGVVFVSARDRDLFIKRKSMSALNEDETPLNTFFVLPSFDGERSAEEQVDLFYKRELNSIYHDGPVSFFLNDKKIAFSRNVLRNGRPARDASGKVNLELFFASLGADNTLADVTAYTFNDHGHSTGHPWVSDDGKKMYFSSDRPGGFGGADIYESHNENGKWSEPKNIGNIINTAGDEFYPYVYADSVLFFTSNGHGGFGGLDNFVSHIQNGSFESPANMSFPINTAMDDFALLVDHTGRKGMFSSNREGGAGYDDIYTFVLNKFTLLGTVVERSSKLPIANATVYIKDPDNLLIDSLLTDSLGGFYTQLPLDKEFVVTSRKSGYTSIDQIRFVTDKNSVLTDTLTIPIWENGLFAQGRVFSNELQAILPGSTVVLENLTSGEIDSINVGADAFYKFLVLPNTKYKITARKAGHIANGFNLNTEGLYRSNLVNDILLEETFLEKLEVLFNFNESVIKGEFNKTLDRFVRDLKRAPTSKVNIGAHADSKGTNKYNLELSGKRAKAVTDYLVQRGISRSRIEATGFGEELILNQCSDGVECTDEEHSLNRRAEVKIQSAGL